MTGGMRHRAWIPATVLSVCVAATGARAQAGPEDYFHAGAHAYFAGKHQEAAVEVEEGLRHWPEDPKLRALAAQLEEMKNRQRNGNRGEDGQKPEEKENDSGQQGQGEDKDSPDSDRDSGDDEENPGDRRDDEAPPDSASPDPRNTRDPAQREPGEMSEAEARRLLDSFADDEKEQQEGRRVPVGTRPGMEQTW